MLSGFFFHPCSSIFETECLGCMYEYYSFGFVDFISLFLNILFLHTTLMILYLSSLFRIKSHQQTRFYLKLLPLHPLFPLLPHGH